MAGLGFLTFDDIQWSDGSVGQATTENTTNGAVSIILSREEWDLLLTGGWNHEVLSTLSMKEDLAQAKAKLVLSFEARCI